MAIHPRTFALLLRRRRAAVLPEGTGRVPPTYVAALLKNIDSLGFTASPALIDRMLTQSEAELTAFYAPLVKALRAMVGADRAWTPMYPNFPAQVMAAPDAELYLNALVHYLGDWVGLRILPEYVREARPPLADQPELKPIGLVDESEAFEIARRLIGSKTSISAEDKGDVTHILAHYPDALERVVPPEIPHKENLAFVTTVLLEKSSRADIVLARYYKTATDILRLVTAISDGDVSLAGLTRFKSMKRSQRRLLLALLDRIPAPLEDMQRHRDRWLRVGERLHPSEHRSRFPRAHAAFAALRNDRRVTTFNARVEAGLATRDVGAVVAIARKRPGELVRRADHLLRIAADPQPVLAALADVVGEVATPVLLQVLAHFRGRAHPPALRAFFPKGDVSKIITRPHELPPLAPEVCARVVAIARAALVKRFAERAPLGKVWLDPALTNYLVPFSQRSASKALRTLVRGSRLPLPPGETLRFFLWWREGKVDGKDTGRVDIDLSAVMYDDAWAFKEQISWTNLRSAKYRGAHSGDITSAPDGACEFIDLDIASVVKYGGRWVVMCLNAFTSQPFCNLPECYAGWMMRKDPGSGEIFEPATVVDKVDIATQARICIPVIVDLRERALFWADLGLREHPNYAVTIESNQRGMVHLGQAITTLQRANLHDLFGMHAEARGTIVAERRDAETVFGVHEGVTPFDLDRIMADFL